MQITSQFAVLGMMALTSLWTALSIFALLRRRPPPVLKRRERVTILKPLRGTDPFLESNLRGYFEQDHIGFDIVFGVEGHSDPALALIEQLRAQYPQVQSRVVVHQGGTALNPKVRNLIAMLAAGTHDVVVVADANVRVPRDYLATSLATLQREGTGLVSHPIAGGGGDTLGGAIESSYLNANVVAGVATATEILGHAAVVGKSMMFRRSVFDPLGGLESVSNVLAEDYVMGRMFQHAGYQVALAHTAVVNTSSGGSLADALNRMIRWSMLRARVQPVAYLLEPLSSPLPILGLILWVGGLPWWTMTWPLLLLLLRDIAAARRVGSQLSPGTLGLAPIREVMWLAAWGMALGRRHVSWRGHRLRVSAGTRLYQTAPGPAVASAS